MTLSYLCERRGSTAGALDASRSLSQASIDYVKNGAQLLQIGSALVSEGIEVFFSRLKKALRESLRANGYKDLGEVVGAAHKR
jgi:dihydroorotate dehydrogenase